MHSGGGVEGSSAEGSPTFEYLTPSHAHHIVEAHRAHLRARVKISGAEMSNIFRAYRGRLNLSYWSTNDNDRVCADAMDVLEDIIVYRGCEPSLVIGYVALVRESFSHACTNLRNKQLSDETRKAIMRDHWEQIERHFAKIESAMMDCWPIGNEPALVSTYLSLALLYSLYKDVCREEVIRKCYEASQFARSRGALHLSAAEYAEVLQYCETIDNIFFLRRQRTVNGESRFVGDEDEHEPQGGQSENPAEEEDPRMVCGRRPLDGRAILAEYGRLTTNSTKTRKVIRKGQPIPPALMKNAPIELRPVKARTLPFPIPKIVEPKENGGTIKSYDHKPLGSTQDEVSSSDLSDSEAEQGEQEAHIASKGLTKTRGVKRFSKRSEKSGGMVRDSANDDRICTPEEILDIRRKMKRIRSAGSSGQCSQASGSDRGSGREREYATGRRSIPVEAESSEGSRRRVARPYPAPIRGGEGGVVRADKVVVEGFAEFSLSSDEEPARIRDQRFSLHKSSIDNIEKDKQRRHSEEARPLSRNADKTSRAPVPEQELRPPKTGESDSDRGLRSIITEPEKDNRRPDAAFIDKGLDKSSSRKPEGTDETTKGHDTAGLKLQNDTADRGLDSTDKEPESESRRPEIISSGPDTAIINLKPTSKTSDATFRELRSSDGDLSSATKAFPEETTNVRQNNEAEVTVDTSKEALKLPQTSQTADDNEAIAAAWREVTHEIGNTSRGLDARITKTSASSPTTTPTTDEEIGAARIRAFGFRRSLHGKRDDEAMTSKQDKLARDQQPSSPRTAKVPEVPEALLQPPELAQPYAPHLNKNTEAVELKLLPETEFKPSVLDTSITTDERNTEVLRNFDFLEEMDEQVCVSSSAVTGVFSYIEEDIGDEQIEEDVPIENLIDLGSFDEENTSAPEIISTLRFSPDLQFQKLPEVSTTKPTSAATNDSTIDIESPIRCNESDNNESSDSVVTMVANTEVEINKQDISNEEVSFESETNEVEGSVGERRAEEAWKTDGDWEWKGEGEEVSLSRTATLEADQVLWVRRSDEMRPSKLGMESPPPNTPPGDADKPEELVTSEISSENDTDRVSRRKPVEPEELSPSRTTVEQNSWREPWRRLAGGPISPPPFQKEEPGETAAAGEPKREEDSGNVSRKTSDSEPTDYSPLKLRISRAILNLRPPVPASEDRQPPVDVGASSPSRLRQYSPMRFDSSLRSTIARSSGIGLSSPPGTVPPPPLTEEVDENDADLPSESSNFDAKMEFERRLSSMKKAPRAALQIPIIVKDTAGTAVSHYRRHPLTNFDEVPVLKKSLPPNEGKEKLNFDYLFKPDTPTSATPPDSVKSDAAD